jgi:hypothetical protein
MIKRLFLLLILLISSALTWTLVQGATSVYSISLTSAKLLQCGANVIEAQYTASALDTSGKPINSFNATQYYVTSNGAAAPTHATLSSGAAHTFYIVMGTSGMSYAEVYLVSNSNPVVRSNTLRINCDRTVQDIGGSSTADNTSTPDNRINYGSGDLINALYARTDPSGKPGIAVYSIDSKSKGWLKGYFSNTLFAPYLGNPPAENTYLGEVDYSKLYALTSGEFQIVIADLGEKKSYSVIFSAFPVKNVYFR